MHLRLEMQEIVHVAVLLEKWVHPSQDAEMVLLDDLQSPSLPFHPHHQNGISGYRFQIQTNVEIWTTIYKRYIRHVRGKKPRCLVWWLYPEPQLQVFRRIFDERTFWNNDFDPLSLLSLFPFTHQQTHPQVKCSLPTQFLIHHSFLAYDEKMP